MKTITPLGIVRNSAITNNKDGNCEEILNLRPKVGRWDAVSRKKLHSIYNDDDKFVITKYFEHKCGDVINLIVMVEKETSIELWWVTERDNDRIANYDVLWSKECHSTENGAETFEIDIESVGNFLSINTPLLITFLFKDGKYTRIDSSSIKPVDVVPYCHSKMSSQGKIISHHLDATLTNVIERSDEEHNGNEVYMFEYAGGKGNTNFYTKPLYDYETLLAQTDTNSISSDQDIEKQNMPMLVCNITYDPMEKENFIEEMGGEYEGMLHEDREHTEGYVLVRTAYEMFDGTYVYPSAPVILHLGTMGGLKNDFYNVDYSYFRDKIVIKKFHLGSIDGNKEGTQHDCHIQAYVRQQNMQSLCFERPNVGDIDTNIYRRVVYFVSKPLSMYDFTKVDFDHLHVIQRFDVSSTWIDINRRGDTYLRHSLTHNTGLEDMKEGFPETVPSTSEMLNQTLYKAVSFDLFDDRDKGVACVECPSGYGKRVDFNSLINGEVLNAQSSFSEYDANVLYTYDRRLHIGGAREYISDNIITDSQKIDFNFNNEIGLSGVTYIQSNHEFRFAIEGIGPRYSYYPYFINQDNAEKTKLTFGNEVAIVFEVQDGVDTIYFTSYHNEPLNFPFVIFPDARCKTAYLYSKQLTTKKYELKMTASGTSDFAFWSGLSEWDYTQSAIIAPREMECNNNVWENVIACSGKWTSSFPEKGEAETKRASIYMGNRLIVSNLNNPVAFPPELNFQFDDDIVTIGNSYKEISMAQDGQYPTYVFTKRGIWAMSVGVSSFYATQVSIHPDVAICRNCKGIGEGIVYVANDGIKIISGRKVVNLSDAMDGCMPKQIATNTSLISALGGGANYAKLNNIRRLYNDNKIGYPINPCDYIKSDRIVFGFDETNNELIVNKCYGDTIGRSYVYSLNFKNWYSISEEFYSFNRNFGVRKGYYIDKIEGKSFFQDYIYNSIVDLNLETPMIDFGARKGEYMPTQVLMITKPLSLSSLGFKSVYHTAFRGQFFINGQSILGTHGNADEKISNPHFGFYILASNDGGNYKMVGGKIFHNSVSQVVLERIKQSYRYIVLVMAGYADVYLRNSDEYGQFSLTHIEMQESYKYNQRLR